MVDISTDFALIDNLLSGSYTDYTSQAVTTLTGAIQQMPSDDTVAEIGDGGVSGVVGTFAISRDALSTYPKVNSRLTVAGKNWRVIRVNLRVLNNTYVCVCTLEAAERIA